MAQPMAASLLLTGPVTARSPERQPFPARDLPGVLVGSVRCCTACVSLHQRAPALAMLSSLYGASSNK